jgi:5-methylcytosine-specific restriction endonuclease McrA
MCRERSRTTLATLVDHIVPHKGDEVLFWDQNNWQGLCDTCHSGAKASYERTGKMRGCDVNGVPLDPGHHWR